MPTIETYRKQAKLFLRWHREGDYSIGERVRRLERYRSLTDQQVLALKFPLALAQEIVAVEAGYQRWADLKAATAGATRTPRAPSSQPFLKRVTPILFVRDVKTSAAFFQQKLGFEIDFLHGLPPFYGAVSRDGVCLHLRYVQQPFFAQAAAEEKSLIVVSIEVSNVQGLFKEFKSRDVEFAQKITRQAWGGTDFHVRDPDGNVLSFVTYS
ncbi:glyoxalase superfamily protein [Tunturibacter empetritectus]|uniref:Catechol 2,3-dioxygenase-like lactoylglutathione lyase family enzyme n=1 Tax=Tunturiibacter empetritectus TaxID=3069691 RepID=A0A7W8II15_9BACT|nr:glyoxalase superfamily protein [Edaphobacter lichenicola]MBB5317540.1 catechol 2,3-dioxygenase-like lactoylglutathione lyase family enzyme [Edaphobacter lichenicola]